MNKLKDPKYLFQSEAVIKAKEAEVQKEHIESLKAIQKELQELLKKD